VGFTLQRSRLASFKESVMRAALLSTALLVVTAVPVQTGRGQQQPTTIPTELALVPLEVEVNIKMARPSQR
jgi:hypothetical protein